MKHFALILLFVWTVSACSTPAEKAAQRLAGRIVPQYNIRFVEKQDTVESFSFRTRGKQLLIEGSSASAMTAGLGQYLKDYCGADISWYNTAPISVPDTMPAVEEPVIGKALVPQRFFLNYCTFGYTMPWWKWAEWERFIDWMALQGINLPLAITGQEAVWQEVWREQGLTDEEIRAYFTGPAHLPWHRMCNIDGVDGPLPQGWIDGQLELQKKILGRERELGMRPVLPAFAGHVPRRLKEIHPESRITPVARWCGFPEENRCFYLSPEDSLFSVIESAYIRTQTRLMGSDHIYGVDLFNEVPPPSWAPDTLAAIGRETFNALKKADKDAQWLQMGWLFYNDRRHWTPERVKAYLEAVPQGKVTILDYYTENIPVWESTEKFYGQPFIFCYLGNFGGNTRLAGPFHKESRRISEGLAAGADGIGCTLEGFGINRWFYEYVLGRAWSSCPQDDEWLARLDRRKRSPEGFWKEMADSIYVRGSFSEGALVCSRPCLEGYHHWTVIHNTPYDNSTLERLWQRLKEKPDACSSDVIAIGCQVLGNRFAVLRDSFADAYRQGERKQAANLASEMQTLLSQLDSLADLDPQLRMSRWLEQAQAWAATPDEEAYYRRNAWHILTTWGIGPGLNDYASRLWSGLIRAYYAPRWKMFTDYVLDCMDSGKAYEQARFDTLCRAWEEDFVNKAPIL